MERLLQTLMGLGQELLFDAGASFEGLLGLDGLVAEGLFDEGDGGDGESGGCCGHPRGELGGGGVGVGAGQRVGGIGAGVPPL